MTRPPADPSLAALDLVVARLGVAVDALQQALESTQSAVPPADAPAAAAIESPAAALPPPPALLGEPVPMPEEPVLEWHPPALPTPAPEAPAPQSRLRRWGQLPFVGGFMQAAARIAEGPTRVEALERRQSAERTRQAEAVEALGQAVQGVVLDLERRRAAAAARERETTARLAAAHDAMRAFAVALGTALAERSAADHEGARRLAALVERVRVLEEIALRQESLRQAVSGIRPLAEALSVLRGAIAALESAVRSPPPAQAPAAAVAAPPEAPQLAAFYLAFENRFRGSREDISSRVRVYLAEVAEAARATGAPVLDLGPGRGEWLEILRDEGVAASGVDTNPAMVAEIRARGLLVHEGDAVAYLRALPAASVAAITGFHVVEHLPFSDLAALFQESFRVLHPGGMIVFETPNPENLIVGACTFWYDPTHMRPLPPPVLLFMAQHGGFERAEVRRLHPPPESEIPPMPEGARDPTVQALLFGPRDYAVVAWRP